MPSILIVEDESIIRSALKRLLERHGHEVSEAASVAEAEALDPQGFLINRSFCFATAIDNI